MSWVRRTDRRSAREEQGAAAVEFALVLPLFLALVFGVISYGYMLSYRQAMSQGAIEAARAVAIAPAGTSDALRTTNGTQALNRTLDPYGLNCSAEGVTCEVIASVTCGTATCSQVRITHAYRDNPLIPSFPGLGVVLPETLTYTAEVER